MFLVASISRDALSRRVADALVPLARVQRVVVLHDGPGDGNPLDIELERVLGPKRVAHVTLEGTAPHSLDAIRELLRAGRTVICDVEPDVDVDLTAALLASSLKADALLLLDDFEGVRGTDRAVIREAGARQLLELDLGHDVRRKVEAAGEFTASTGRPALIGCMGPKAGTPGVLRGTTVVGGDAPIRTR